MLISAAGDMGPDLAAHLETKKNAYERVFWCLIEHPKLFDSEPVYAHTYSLPKSSRETRVGFPEGKVAITEPMISKLKEHIQATFKLEERAKKCKMEKRRHIVVNLKRWVLLGVCAVAGIGLAHAGTIVSLDGPNDSSYVIGNSDPQYLANSWSATNAYTGVAISFQGNSFGGLGSVPETAYLMTKIGPGTTVAQQVATSNFSSPAGLGTINIFSGLSLGPGTYYLVLVGLKDPRAFGGWEGTDNPGNIALVTDTG